MKKKAVFTILVAIFAAVALTGAFRGPKAKADEEKELVPVEISTPEELLAIRENPRGIYELTDDIDMAGVEWIPFEFFGTLNGGGHAILNLSVTTVGTETRDTYDGNMKVYDTYFAGLFSVLNNAVVSNLTLYGLQVKITEDRPVFAAGVAGYMENAIIHNVTLRSALIDLHAHDRMFGVGGLAGYGYGKVSNCDAEVTLVTTDTDRTTRDEQYLGGVYGAGYADIVDCKVNIDGYISETGYVHSGGLVGMYVIYPKGTAYAGAVTGNTVKGKITFFENNTNRRAYCEGRIGEVMNWTFAYNGNDISGFKPEEIFTYDTDLTPMGLKTPRDQYPPQLSCDHEEETEDVAATCTEFGYTKHTCKKCGYVWNTDYKKHSHDFEWTVVKEPTLDVFGEKEGVCKNCGEKTTEQIAKLTQAEWDEILKLSQTPTPEPSPTPEPTEGVETPSDTPVEELPSDDGNAGRILLIAFAVLGVVGCAALFVIIFGTRSKRR
ncbi:MAG: hypothetical protein J6U10_00890 [Lachnospiraceae bacterium]|nr:hypothetical protein [Lachnospiraceae bacterium]